MRQREDPALPLRRRRAAQLPYSVHVCYRAIRGHPPFAWRWIWERRIERAIDNIKRSEWDKWFRREWYKAGARRRCRGDAITGHHHPRTAPSMEVVEMEQVVKADDIDREELAKLLADLIRHDPQVRGAVMQVAYDTPGIMVEY